MKGFLGKIADKVKAVLGMGASSPPPPVVVKNMELPPMPTRKHTPGAFGNTVRPAGSKLIRLWYGVDGLPGRAHNMRGY